MADTLTTHFPVNGQDPIITALPISYGGGNQVIAVGRARGVYISTGGNLVVTLMGDPNTQITFTGLLVGTVYWLAIDSIIQTGSSAAGLILF